MKKISLLIVCSIFMTSFLFSQQDFQGINGINVDNYPRIDGSTSTEPLNTLIACKLLGFRYEWKPYLFGNGIWRLEPNIEDYPDNFFGERIKSTQTHNSIINLIDNQTDLIISARKMSADEKMYAESLGVSLIETPIALDALDMLVSKQNTINSLTVKQIQGIYLGEITNWDKLGGADEEIKPFIRNANSGSQEMMKEIVMDHAGMPDWEVGYTNEGIINTMAAVYTELSIYPNGICFTPHYYKEYIIRDAVGADNVKSIAIEGVFPDVNSIKNKTYPFVAEVFVSIRSDLDPSSMAFKLYEWLQSKSGKDVIAESGYVPFENSVNNNFIINYNENEEFVYPNPATNGIYIAGINNPAQMTLFDFSGRIIVSEIITKNEFININHLPKGVYIIDLQTKTGNRQFKLLKK